MVTDCMHGIIIQTTFPPSKTKQKKWGKERRKRKEKRKEGQKREKAGHLLWCLHTPRQWANKPLKSVFGLRVVLSQTKKKRERKKKEKKKKGEH
jgi:hypothetical protein